MKRTAGLDHIIDLSADVSELADLVDDVASVLNFDVDKAQLFTVMLLDAVAAPQQDAHVDMMQHPEIPATPPVSPAAPMPPMAQVPPAEDIVDVDESAVMPL